MRDIPPPLRDALRRVWRSPASPLMRDTGASRPVPEETPIAFSYEGLSYAVMMATPTDLADFAIGFSLTEGIIKSACDIESLEIVPTEGGILLRMSLTKNLAARFWERRRYLAGPSGCGLCGLESIAEAIRMPPAVSDGVSVSQKAIFEAMALLPGLQTLNHATGALHAAALWAPTNGIVSVREDVGRHNALDKLTGAAAQAGFCAANSAVLLTSRVSVEMVQKVAALGAPILVAVSAPTALAVRVAEAARITLIGVARRDSFESFTHPQRIYDAKFN